jgi:hypothetical protein
MAKQAFGQTKKRPLTMRAIAALPNLQHDKSRQIIPLPRTDIGRRYITALGFVSIALITSSNDKVRNEGPVILLSKVTVILK